MGLRARTQYTNPHRKARKKANGERDSTQSRDSLIRNGKNKGEAVYK